jgi:hypothetical protein
LYLFFLLSATFDQDTNDGNALVLEKDLLEEVFNHFVGSVYIDGKEVDMRLEAFHNKQVDNEVERKKKELNVPKGQELREDEMEAVVSEVKDRALTLPDAYLLFFDICKQNAQLAHATGIRFNGSDAT